MVPQTIFFTSSGGLLSYTPWAQGGVKEDLVARLEYHIYWMVNLYLIFCVCA